MRHIHGDTYRLGWRKSVCLAIIAVLGVQAACDRGNSQSRPSSTQPATAPSTLVFPAELLGRFYQANGALEMDKNEEAAGIYRELIERGVLDAAIKGNLAIALLGLQKYEEADRLTQDAERAEPANPDILLVRSAALAATGRNTEADALLQRIVREHPSHTAALWSLALRMEANGELGPAEQLEIHERLLRQAPRNLAALLSAIRAAAAARELERTGVLLERIRAIVVEPAGPLLQQFEAIRAGIETKDDAAVLRAATVSRNLLRQTDRFRSDVLALGTSGTSLPGMIRHPISPIGEMPKRDFKTRTAFKHIGSLDGRDGATQPAGEAHHRIAIGSISKDRSPAIFHHGGKKAGRLYVWRNTKLNDVTDAVSLASAPPCSSATFVDLNNDRLMDLVLSCTGGDHVYRLDINGVFGDATKEFGLNVADASIGACPFDFDNDGDLDLLRWTASKLIVHRNDGEGVLTEIPPRPGLDSAMLHIRSIQPADLDDDGDVDLFITLGRGPFTWHLISNERLATFRDVTRDMKDIPHSLSAEPVIADFDNDGWLEILDAVSGTSFEIDEAFGITQQKGPIGNESSARAGVAGDFDCDGWLEVISVRADGTTSHDGVRVGDGDALTSFDLNGDGILDLVSNSGIVFLGETTDAHNWLSVGLHALNTGDSRFNSIGLFSTIEIRAGSLYQKRTVTSATTHFGLGPYTHADVMRVIWPNGSYQNLEFRASDRMRLAANQIVIEEQSLKGSCPYLYAWNGEQHEFVTDVLWRSALGMSIMSGVLGHHGTADDYFKFRGEQLAARDGMFELQFTEELWETSYFDYCRLFAVDHPIGTDVFVDEKCLAPPYPPFEIFRVKEMRQIVSATDENGRDLTELLRMRDDRFVAGFEQTRYQGIVEDHDLILDLGAFEQNETVRLYLTGWLWPTDASTNVAVSQNPTMNVKPPTFSVVASDGSWRALALTGGFPSGKNKTLVYDLNGLFETGDHLVKLATNFAIFWDHAFCTVGPQDVEIRTTILPVASADLHWRGFSHEYVRVANGPTIPEYDAIDDGRFWRDLEGDYTSFGDVTELLHGVDDRYVILGAGDEVTMRFDATALPELVSGWRRDFIVHTDGWLKDGDLNSATGKTVGPLPFHGMSAYPYANEGGPPDPGWEAYRKRYNSRKRSQNDFRDRIRGLSDAGAR